MRTLVSLLALLTTAPAIATPLLCPPGETRIAAHRGRLDAALTENSLTQMRATAQTAPYMLEIDLSQARDGTIFLLHDDDLNRTTDGTGPIAASDSATVARLELRSGDGKPSGEPVPHFADVAAWAEKMPDALLMLDIKRTPPAAVAPIIRVHRLNEHVLVLTFSPVLARQAIAADPDWLISVLVRDEGELAAYSKLFGARRFAAYLPAFAPPTLFAAARTTGAVLLSDAMAEGPDGSTDETALRAGVGAYARAIEKRPVDILVTDHAGKLPACFRR